MDNKMEQSPRHETSELPYALRDKRELTEGETFNFGCHSGLSCFTDCCADINIFLTPVDVLRLSRKLNLSTTDFLDRHTLVPITKELHLPVVVLRMGADTNKRCPFVADTGCQVYEDRPWSCRMYPVGMGLPPARAGEEPKPMFFLFEDEFCKGREEQAEWTVAKWRADQGVERQEEIETGYREIVSHPWFIGGTRRLDPKRMEMFYTGCYDLDTFRRFVFESTFLNRFELDEELVEKIRASDEELLRFAFRWLRFALFAEPTLKIRPGSDK
jgi:Fe-S-cluster containining protein